MTIVKIGDECAQDQIFTVLANRHKTLFHEFSHGFTPKVCHVMEDLENAGFKMLEWHPAPRKPPTPRRKLRTKVKQAQERLKDLR